MYRPRQIGILREHCGAVSYHEFASVSSRLVSCFWELRTRQPLASGFQYFVLPDGCVDMVFDASDDPDFVGALVMTPSLSAIKLDLGKEFAYVGVRLQPGVWADRVDDIVGSSIQIDKLAGCDLRRTRDRLAAGSNRQAILEDLVRELELQGVISENYLVQAIMSRPADTVDAYAMILGYSRRQTQRILHERLGFAPHDFLKVVRFQQALSENRKGASYTDQSHYIREFKRITGMTPAAFRSVYG